jgi:hypothetical protein
MFSACSCLVSFLAAAAGDAFVGITAMGAKAVSRAIEAEKPQWRMLLFGAQPDTA